MFLFSRHVTNRVKFIRNSEPNSKDKNKLGQETFKVKALVVALVVLGSLSWSSAGQTTSERAAKSVLAEKCLNCHGEMQLSELDLRTRERMLRGGKRGPAVIPGNAKQSPLYLAAAHSATLGLPMPPESDRLPEEQLEILRRWIDEGLPWEIEPEPGSAFGAPSPSEVTLSSITHPEPAESIRADAGRLTDEVMPSLPGRGSTPVPRKNLIDEYIFGKMEKDGVPHTPLCTDEEYLRRVHIDLWGRLPDPEKIRSFVEDKDPDKRDKLIDEMLGLRFEVDPLDPYGGAQNGPWLVDEAFLNKWTYWFGDLFKNSTAQLGSGRNSFRDFIYSSLKLNVPYSEFVLQMLTATSLTGGLSGAANLLIRDHVDAATDVYIMHEDTLDEIAVSTAKYFLGLNLECVSCHDGAGHLEGINLYLTQKKRVELWNQAAFFGNIRIFRPMLTGQEFTLLEGPPLRPEKNWHTGGNGYNTDAPSVIRVPRRQADVQPQFYVNAEKPQPGRNLRQEFARILIEHPQFSRATVNWIWSELMVVGIVDPPHDFDLLRQDPKKPPPAPWTIQPTHPELLNALAEDFRNHNYDLRHLMALITKSSAYQLSSRFYGTWKAEYASYYARRLVRRLSAEELFDAVSAATQVFPEITVNGTDKKVQYILATYSNEDVKDEELRRFLHFFGQSNRDKDERDLSGSIVQATLLLNSDIIKKKVSTDVEGSRVHKLLRKSPPLTNEEFVEELFLGTLSRFPTQQETEIGVEMLEKYRDRGAEDLQWALLNKLDFVFNY